MSCVFCAIVAGEAPAIRIYEDDDYLAILDIRPFTRGHTLVIPKRHTVDLTDTPPDTVAGMVALGQRIARAARRRGCTPTATTSSSTTARPPSSPCSTSTCTCCRGRRRQAVVRQGHAAAPRPRSRRIRTAACGRHWRNSTRLNKTDAMDISPGSDTSASRCCAARQDLQGAPTAGSGTRSRAARRPDPAHRRRQNRQKRANSLSYARDGDDYLVVASKGGDPKAPGWYHNLKANPNVEINVGPKRFPRHGATSGARRSRLSAAVADRQQHDEQQEPLHRVPEARPTAAPIPVVATSRSTA